MVVKETALRLAACNPPAIAQVRSKILAQILILHKKKIRNTLQLQTAGIYLCRCCAGISVCVEICQVALLSSGRQ